MMDEDRFWDIIEQSRTKAKKHRPKNGDELLDHQMEELSTMLRKLPAEEIVGFKHRFEDLCNREYRWDLWAAAYWLHGGCSDDAFIDFRSTLVSLGKEMFTQVLADPDALADLVDRPDVPYLGSEGFQYVATRVYKEKTGQEYQPGDEPTGPANPKGRRIDHDNEAVMRRRFPKLVAKYPDMGD
jgi:hypothetical protein